MASPRDLSEIIAGFRETTARAERRAKRRIALTALLAIAAVGYMGWLHSELSKLDAEAISDVARAEVEARLPELGERLTQTAVDAAPGIMDRGEAALMAAPVELRGKLEERLAQSTDRILDEVSVKLDAELDGFVGPRLELLEKAGEGGDPPPLDDLMTEMRATYREKAGALMAEIYVAYAREIGGVNDYLLHLRDGESLTRREQIEREIIEASVALRQHYIEPIEPVGVSPDDETAER